MFFAESEVEFWTQIGVFLKTEIYLCYHVENIMPDAVFPSDNAADTKQEKFGQQLGRYLLHL